MDVATLLIERRLPYPDIGLKELNNMGQVIYTCQLISKITYINAPFRKESGTPKCRHGILKSCESNEYKDIVYVCPYSNERYNCPDISDGKIDFTNFWKDIIELFNEKKQLFYNCVERLNNVDLDTNTKTEFDKYYFHGNIWLNTAEKRIEKAYVVYFSTRIKSANKK